MARFSKHLKILTAVSLLGLTAGCETLESINPFGGSSKKSAETIEKYDDRPIYKKTGDLPPDNANADYTDEDVKASP